MFRKKKYHAKFWCTNCGNDIKAKLPFGVIPVQEKKLVHLYDVQKSALVDVCGRLVCQQVYLFCPNCGSYEINQYRWRATGKD